MKVYIAGKITGTNDYRMRFKDMEYRLKKLGYLPVNPVPIIERIQNEKNRLLTHDECMAVLIPVLGDCEGICMLDGWEDSPGAREEYVYATVHNKVEVKVKWIK